MKPILFNTEMVKAILSGRKTMTRRICNITINGSQKVPGNFCTAVEFPVKNFLGVCANFFNEDGFYRGAAQQRYFKGDILYVRETWLKHQAGYEYLADGWQTGIVNIDGAGLFHWHPSIHMPKEAARIFLRVKDVRVERLQDMHLKDFLAEGVILTSIEKSDCVKAPVRARERFFAVWNSTIKKSSIDKYGWDANPWVWVIEFEQISKSKALEEDSKE